MSGWVGSYADQLIETVIIRSEEESQPTHAEDGVTGVRLQWKIVKFFWIS